jgi:hypothetical protein
MTTYNVVLKRRPEYAGCKGPLYKVVKGFKDYFEALGEAQLWGHEGGLYDSKFKSEYYIFRIVQS